MRAESMARSSRSLRKDNKLAHFVWKELPSFHLRLGGLVGDAAFRTAFDELKGEDMLARSLRAVTVNQTKGKPLPSIGRVQGLSLGIRLSIPRRLPPRGISEGRRIILLPNLSSAEHAAVLAQELADEFLHHQPDRKPTSKTA
jgi:hypothetical protein